MTTKKTIKQGALLAGAAVLLFGATAEAQRGWGRGGGWRGGGGPRLRCAKLLMKAHPDVLKAKLGLSDAQTARISKVRVNFLGKRITARAEIQKLRLQMRTLYEASDLPNEQKLLTLMRKMRGQRGRMMEERVKTHLRVMRILTKEQRVQMRTKCQEMGWGKGRRGRRWGRGPGAKRGGGWGQGPGW